MIIAERQVILPIFPLSTGAPDILVTDLKTAVYVYQERIDRFGVMLS